MRFIGAVLISITALQALLPQAGAAEQFLMCSLRPGPGSSCLRSLDLTLKSLLPEGSVAPTVLLKELPEPNAFALPGSNTIVISLTLFDLIHSSAEEVFVVAHELGHLRQALTVTRDSVGREHDADLFAIRNLTRLNLDPHSSLRLLHRLQQTGAATSIPLPKRLPIKDLGQAKILKTNDFLG